MDVDLGRTQLEESMVLKNADSLKNYQDGRSNVRSNFAEWREMISEPNSEGSPT